MIRNHNFLKRAIKSKHHHQFPFSKSYNKILGPNIMIQNYFSMSHTNDVINCGFKRGVQKSKINDIFNPGYFFLLSFQSWLLGVIIKARIHSFFTECYRKIRKLSICWNYGINDIFAKKWVNFSVFRLKDYSLNYACAYFFFFSFPSHMTGNSNQEKSSYRLWKLGFWIWTGWMACYISKESAWSVELKNVH